MWVLINAVYVFVREIKRSETREREVETGLMWKTWGDAKLHQMPHWSLLLRCP